MFIFLLNSNFSVLPAKRIEFLSRLHVKQKLLENQKKKKVHNDFECQVKQHLDQTFFSAHFAEIPFTNFDECL